MEVLSVFVLSYLFRRAVLDEFARMEVSILGWSYSGGFLLILIPVCILLLTKRSFEAYGLTLKEWGYNLNVGMTCYIVLLIPSGLILLLSMYRISHAEMTGSLVLVAGEITALLLILTILRRRESQKRSSSALDLLVLVLLLLLPILVGIFLGRLTLKIVSTVIWQFFLSGFGEEIRYRGYYQSRMNEEFGRPYTFLGANFGPGLIISSLLFAFAHVLNPFNPFIGRFDLSLWWGLWTFFSGLFFGFVRERTGSILAAGIAHGLPDAVGEAFALLFSLEL